MPGTLADTTDTWLLGDFLPNMPEVSGITALAQRLVRRLQTPRGLFPFWPNFGLDVRQFALSKTPPWQIASQVEQELLKDEQVQSVIVTPSQTDGGRALRLDVFVAAAVGNFVFTMTATEAAATLIQLQKAA